MTTRLLNVATARITILAVVPDALSMAHLTVLCLISLHDRDLTWCA
jgi:hypothetical protein